MKVIPFRAGFWEPGVVDLEVSDGHAEDDGGTVTAPDATPSSGPGGGSVLRRGRWRVFIRMWSAIVKA